MMERERVNQGKASEGFQVARAKPAMKELRKKLKANDTDKIQGRDRAFDDKCEEAGLPLPVSFYQSHSEMPMLTHSWPEIDLGVVVGEPSWDERNTAAMLGWRLICVADLALVIPMVLAAFEERMPCATKNRS